jgi:hypothetical protein
MNSHSSGKFDKDASRYHPAVYSRKRAEVVKAIEVMLTPLHSGQLKNLHTKLQKAFKQDLDAALKLEGSDFALADKECKTRIEKTFVAGAEGEFEYLSYAQIDWSDSPCTTHRDAIQGRNMGLPGCIALSTTRSQIDRRSVSLRRDKEDDQCD